jgi:hypothetical protein
MSSKKLLSAVFTTGLLLLPGKIAKAGLIGFYTFNGNVADSSGNGNDGTIHGNPTFTNNGPFGGSALTLAGNNTTFNSGAINTPDYVTIPINTAIENTPQETFGGWFLLSSSASTCCIRGLISSDDGGFDPTLDVDTRSGSFQYSAFTGGAWRSKGAPANNGQWTFAAVSYDNIAHSYIFQVGNNQVTGTLNFDGGGVKNITYLGINPNFDFELNGEIADAFFYNNALNADQLNAIQQGGPAVIADAPSSAAPEPATYILIGIGLISMGAKRFWSARRFRLPAL